MSRPSDRRSLSFNFIDVSFGNFVGIKFIEFFRLRNVDND